MRFILICLFILCSASLSFAEAGRGTAKSFVLSSFKYIYYYNQGKISFKSNSDESIGEYVSQIKLSLLEDDEYKQFNTTFNIDNVLYFITQWENGRYTTVRVFAPLANQLVGFDRLYCEVDILGNAFDWKTQLGQISTRKDSNGKHQLIFTDLANEIHICGSSRMTNFAK